MDSFPVVFAQYGAVGIIAALSIMALRMMFKRDAENRDRERDELIRRNARLEEELNKLNETIRNEYVTTITKSSQAIADANSAINSALAALMRR